MAGLSRKADVGLVPTIIIAFIFLVIGGEIILNLLEEYKTHACELRQVEKINGMMEVAAEVLNGQTTASRQYNLELEWCVNYVYVSSSYVQNQKDCQAINLVRSLSGGSGILIGLLSCLSDPVRCISTPECSTCLAMNAGQFDSAITRSDCIYSVLNEESLPVLAKPCYACYKKRIESVASVVPVIGKFKFLNFDYSYSNSKFDITNTNKYVINIVKGSDGYVTLDAEKVSS